MNAYIVEDEYLGLERLRKLIAEVDPSMNIVGHSDSIKGTVQWLRDNPAPDLIFMDIELADGQCFEIFNQVQVPSPLIFTTSYDEHALRAFQENSVDYLLKPVRKEDLRRSIDKYLRLKQQMNDERGNIERLVASLRQLQTPLEYRKRFLVRQGERMITVETAEIAWFMADGKICFMRTWNNQRFIVDYNLDSLSEMLDPADFYRINRQYLVHAKAVKEMRSYFHGKLFLTLLPPSGQNDVIVSKEKAMDFKRWMGK